MTRRAHPDEPVVTVRLLESVLDADRIVLLRELRGLGLTLRPANGGRGHVVPAGVAWALTRGRSGELGDADAFARSLEPQLRAWARREVPS